ncbi:MAG: hypothetical protein HYV04_17020 [Deltaproteobacteria bacterium]|nr:hypothetical protein [Deltaproteobacteria bacterium]
MTGTDRRDPKTAVLEATELAIAGMSYDRGLLWLATPEDRLVATYDPVTGTMAERLVYAHEVWDVAVDSGGFWLVTGGGKLGRRIVLWSLEEERELKQFDCPDGAASGLTRLQDKLWVAHRHNRKLFCLDAQSGKVNWVIRTDHECFSPAAYKNELWLIESDPGPLGHWSRAQECRYFFSRFDPGRERIVERLPVAFAPSCMAFDGARFWYAEEGKKGFASTARPLPPRL